MLDAGKNSVGAEMGTAILAGTERSRSAGRGGVAIVVCLGLLILVLGVAVFAQAPWRQAAAHLAARSWPTAEATILSISLKQEPGQAASELVLSVGYEYEVGDAVFAGSRASLADRSDIDDRRLKTLYRKLVFAKVTGKTMPASYDPVNPASAFLDLSFDWKSGLLFAGLGIALIVVGFAIISSPLRRG